MKQKIKELEDKILYHNDLYWNENKPEISDIDYDNLIRELEEVDPNNPIIKKIHDIRDEGIKKIKHKYPMLSLDKVYEVDDLIKWCQKVSRSDGELFLIQPKFDGCSAEINNDTLSTRGDGYEGQDITSKLDFIDLLSIKPYNIGEIVISKDHFIYLKEKFPEYKTQRNACSGILNRDDLDEFLKGLLTFVPFNYITAEQTLKEIKRYDWNIHIYNFKALQYPTDGIVIKLADEEYSKSLGNTSHHPRGQIAFKFTNPIKSSILRGVIWQSGKRKLTPVGQIDPIEISGVTISRVNLHNYRYICEKDIRIGDSLIIERSGDVIPNVQKVIPNAYYRKEIFIYNCPVCNHPIIYKNPDIYCTNNKCSGKLLQLLSDSVTRIGIERLGKPTLKKLIDKGVRNLIGILQLTKEDVLQLDGFCEKSSQNLIDEIQKVINKGVYEWQILASLNIKDVGERLSKIILKDRTLEELINMTIDGIGSINGIGHKKSIRIRQGLAGKRNYLDRLRKTLPIIEEEGEEIKKTICFTGKMPEKRSIYEDNAKKLGFAFVKDVTKDLGILVCLDVNKTSSKILKAKKYGVKIISLHNWLEGRF